MSKGKLIWGIDFGTANTAVTTIQFKNNIALPEPLYLEEAHRTIATALYFDENNSYLVGNLAVNSWRENNASFIRWLKMNISKANFIYTPRSTNGVKLGDYDIYELISLFFKHILDKCSSRYEKEMEDVIISIPAYFGDNERQKIIDCMRILNIKAELLEEPTAALISYIYDEYLSNENPVIEGNEYYAIFDLGAGTFDISIAQVNYSGNKYKITIIANAGANNLGGFYIDLEILKYVVSKAKEIDKANADYYTKLEKAVAELTETGLVKDQLIWYKLCELLDMCEKIKLYFTEIKGNIKRRFVTINENVQIQIVREEFDTIIDKFITEIDKICVNAFNIACNNSNGEINSYNDIDKVIRIGLQTNTQKIKEYIKNKFHNKLHENTDVDLAVARGNAIYAAYKNDIDLGDIEFYKCANHNYGVKIGSGSEPICIIEHGEIYPFSQPRQKKVIASSVLSPDIKIDCFIDNYSTRQKRTELIKQITYFHPFLYAGDEISVSLDLDENGMLSVQAIDEFGESVDEKVQDCELTQKDIEERQAKLADLQSQI